MSTVSIKNAHKYYNKGRQNELHVMNGISLELPSSGMVAIFGRSGCGKTTLLNAIGGLDRIHSGEITLFGENIKSKPDAIRNKYIGYIFQNYNLNPKETVYDNVAAALRLAGMKDEDKIFERTVAALSNVEMENFKFRTPDTLSGGQQQRVAIARALIKNPKIILADEPTGNLDEANTLTVMEILKEISKTQLVLLVTHEANLVDLYCDRVIELSDGRVVSVRENESTSGYRQKNKNDIYLGEKEKSVLRGEGVTLEYFGEPIGEISLRIVSHEGKLYLESNCESLKILDSGSEIKLREGTFKSEDLPKHRAKIDMSRLPPYEGKKFGKLYTFGSTFVSALKDNFAPSKKKGKKLLKITMFLLSLVLVFITATAGVPIKDLINIRSNVNPNLFYIPIDPKKDYSKVYESIGKNGIDYAKLIGPSPTSDSETINFRVGNFITASSTVIRASGRIMDARFASDLPLLAGKSVPESHPDIIITSSLADDIIASSTYSYIESYEDLIGLVTSEKYMEKYHLRITGVVESEEKCFYLGALPAAWFTFEVAGINHPFTAASFRDETEEIPVGMIDQYYLSGNSPLYSSGATVKAFGRTYTIRKTEKIYTSLFDFKKWVNETGKKDLPTFEEYLKTHPENGKKDDNQLYSEWFFDVQWPFVREFAKTVFNNSKNGYIDQDGSVIMPDYQTWAIQKDIIINYIEVFGETDLEMLYASYLFRQSNGRYPTSSETDKFISDSKISFHNDIMKSNEENMNAFNSDVYSSGNFRYDVYSSVNFVMNDSDYISLSYSAGESDTKLPVSGFYIEQFYGEEKWYSNHLTIHASDVQTAGEYLRTNFGDGVITPDDIFDEMISEYRESIIEAFVSIAVVLILMCLCTFFIMRSNFMSKVKEIGIMRAIGVSKKNVTFRFAVEAFVLTTVSFFPGYILTSLFITSLSDVPLFGEAFFFPGYIAFFLFAIIYAASVFFGILPALMLLRKTPSEILAKYDI